MAIDLYSGETPPLTSPRISFSHDLSQSDINEQRLLQSLPIPSSSSSSSSSSTVDFDFCIRRSSLDQQSSSADDLFSDGKILPIDPKLNRQPPPLPPPPPPLDHAVETQCHQNSNETTAVSVSSESSHDQKPKSPKSSFWQFRRSSSLNCDNNGYAHTLCPIPLLSRSNSTGSASTSKKSSSSSPRDVHPNHKQQPQKLVAPLKNSQFSAAYGQQKPPLKKNFNGVRVNPVLNVSSGNFFGLGSIFTGNKEKNKKK